MAALALLFSITLSAQLAPSADPRPVPVSGIVLDSAGKPAAGVTVWLIDGLPAEAFRWFGDELRVAPYAGPGVGLPRIRVETRTDASGRFALEVPASFIARRWQNPLVLLAHQPGTPLAIHRLPGPLGQDPAPVDLPLQAGEGTALRVLAPAGTPVAGAIVEPRDLDDVPLDVLLGGPLGGTTDSQGRVVLASVPRGLLREVAVTAPGLGTQRLRIDGDPAADLRLTPVGRLAGRLVAQGNEPIRGVSIKATTLVGGFAGTGRSGWAQAAADASGRFEIPAIAAGMLTLEVVLDPRAGARLCTEPHRGIVVADGTTTELTIPLLPSVRIAGSVQEQGTNRPITGALVQLDGMFGGDCFAVTDSGGKYEGFIARENFQPYGWTIREPIPFFFPTVIKDTYQRMPPPGTDELVIPPLERPRGVDVPGRVVDDMGRAVAGATVEGTWRHGTGRTQLAMARADAQGRFVLHGVDPAAELTYRAWRGDLCTSGTTTAQASAALTKPVTLSITPKAAAQLGGRVLDTAGQPIAGAAVRVWRVGRGKDGGVTELEPILSGDGRAIVRSGSDGRYQTLRKVHLPDEFFAEVQAPGRLGDRSLTVLVADEKQEIPSVILRRVGSISGQVVDRQGQPVAGALVRQAGDGPMPTEATTNVQGRFELPGVRSGPAIVTVSKPGYRIEPHLVADSQAPDRPVLTRSDEPAARAYSTLPPAMTAEQELALIRRLVSPLARRILKEGTEDDRRRIMSSLAEIDPAWALEHLDSVKFADPDAPDEVRASIAGALLRDDADEAATVIESIKSPAQKVFVYASSARELLKRDPARARQYLDQAIVNLRLASPRSQVFSTQTISDLLVDLGETQRARQWLKDQRQKFESLYTGGQRSYYIASQILVPMARIDAPAALAEFETLRRNVERESNPRDPIVFDRQLDKIAFHLADRSPAEAERLLRRVASSGESIRSLDGLVLGICRRMAARDLPRARSLTGLIGNAEIEEKAFALGLMAGAIAQAEKTTALRLLDEAYTELERQRARGRVSQFCTIAGVAGGLLPIVEQVDASRLPEYLSRAIALRPLPGAWSEGSYIPNQNARLAMMVARYDRKLAALVIQPDLDRLGKLWLSAHGIELRTRVTLCALALVDPLRAVEMIESLPESPGPGLNGFTPGENDIRIDCARLLSLRGDDRWRQVYQQFLLVWTPDQELR